MPATLERSHEPGDLLLAASALDDDQFERLIGDLLRVRAGRLAGKTEADEIALLARINAGLSPALWANYHRLRKLHESQTLTDTEHAELLDLTDTIELFQAERAAALAELANRRGIPLDQLLTTLGLPRPTQE
jgi:hypothetical protein